MEDGAFFNRVEGQAAGLTIDQAVKFTSDILPHPADAPLPVLQEALVGTELALDSTSTELDIIARLPGGDFLLDGQVFYGKNLLFFRSSVNWHFPLRHSGLKFTLLIEAYIVNPQLQLFQRPRLFQGQMPIRGAVANLINALTVKSTGVRRRQKEDEQAYEEHEKDVEASKMAQARLRRKSIYKEHGIEM